LTIIPKRVKFQQFNNQQHRGGKSMKKFGIFVLFAICIVCIGMFSGCGSSTSTTTTTVAVNSTEVNAAKAGVLVASGGASTGSSASGVGSAAGTKILSIRAADSGPPASFFDPISVDGYMLATTESVGGNMTPYIRLKTVGGVPVDRTFLASLKIAKWLTLEVQTIMNSGGSGRIPPGMTAEVISYAQRYVTAYIASSPIAANRTHPFSDATLFRIASTEADYMAWMFMYPSIEAGISQMALNITSEAPSHVYMVTPEATNSQKIGGMQMKMVFAKSATGEITIDTNTDPDGKPIVGTYSGKGTLTTPIGSMETTMLITFNSAGPPSALKVVGTTETTPKYTVVVNMSPTTMTATGEVRNSAGTVIGTLEGTSTGGKVYVGTSSEAFSF
jgi:hypothetical protein